MTARRTLPMRFYILILLPAALLAGAGCDSAEPTPPIESVRIEVAEPVLFGVGDARQLALRVLDAEGARVAAEDVSWKVSDRSILEVSSEGLVTARALGEAVVTATVEGVIDAQRMQVVPRYVLPYAAGSSFWVIQAFGGTFSHSGIWHYSYDFVMPIRTEIRAARGGTVIHAEESYIDNDNEPGHENYIMIDHGDGTVARYLHLTHDGALAEVGETVEAGDVIALSGNTGFSTLPHLHFDVTAGCGLPMNGCMTTEYWFANTTPPQPQANTSALAE